MITRLDRHLAVPLDYAADLLDTLDALAEILRHVEHDLRHALAEDHPDHTYHDLVATIDHHAQTLRRATSPVSPAVTP
jgi:type VI protein secretion system component VasF